MAKKDEMKDLERMIGKVPKFFKELTVNDPQMYEMVMKLEGHVWDDGALTRKTKRLIAIAIALIPAGSACNTSPACGCSQSWTHQGRD